MPNKINLFEYIEQNTLRCEVSHRGGGIEIDASEFLDLPGAKATAYQNYLGGGMAGSIQGDRNFSQCAARRENKYRKLSEALKQYFYCLSNDEAANWDEWAASSSFETQQSRPASAY